MSDERTKVGVLGARGKVGREVCAVLLHHRLRIQAAVGQYVEPQIAAMLEELTRSLDAPFDPNGEPGLTEP